MGEIVVQGSQAFYRDQGKGDKAVLCLHGAGGNSLHWMEVAPPSGWRLLALDLPGHGQSAGAPYDTISGYARWVADFVEKRGERLVLCGHSMGGAIAMKVALEQPELLEALVLVGTGARLSVAPAILDVCRAGDAPRVQELVSGWAFSPLVGVEKIRDWYSRFGHSDCTAYLADFTACNGFDIRNRLGEINQPALVVCGDSDRLTPLKYSRYLVENLPKARLAEIPEAGHMVMLEQPDLFNAALAEFCLALGK